MGDQFLIDAPEATSGLPVSLSIVSGPAALNRVYTDRLAGASYVGTALDHHTALVDVSTFPHKTLGQWHQFFSRDFCAQWNLPLLPRPAPGYAEYSVRAVGWPLLIAAGAWITGLDAEPVSKILSHFCVLLAALFTALSLKRLQCGREIALFGAVTVFLGSSYWIFANTAMAEAALGADVACVIYAMVAGNGILLGLALALGAWLKFQFLAPSMALFLLGLVLIPPHQRIRLMAAFFLGISSYLLFNFLTYGQIKPPMLWTPGSPFKAFNYFFLDPKTSIILRNPWIIVLSMSLIVSSKEVQKKNLYQVFGYFIFILILPPLFYGIYDGGSGYPCRLIQPILIVLAILLGIMLKHSGGVVRVITMLLVTLSILINLVAAFSDPQLTWSPTWFWMKAFFQHLS
jgi:hypothetical protein